MVWGGFSPPKTTGCAPTGAPRVLSGAGLTSRAGQTGPRKVNMVAQQGQVPSTPKNDVHYVIHMASRAIEFIDGVEETRKQEAELLPDRVYIGPAAAESRALKSLTDGIGTYFDPIKTWAVDRGVWVEDHDPRVTKYRDVASLRDHLCDIVKRARIESRNWDNEPLTKAAYLVDLYDWNIADVADRHFFIVDQHHYHQPRPSQAEWERRRVDLAKAFEEAEPILVAWGFLEFEGLHLAIPNVDMDSRENNSRRDYLYRRINWLVEAVELRGEIERAYPGLNFPPAPLTRKGLSPHAVRDAITYFWSHLSNMITAKRLYDKLKRHQDTPWESSDAFSQARDKIVRPLWSAVRSCLQLAYIAGERWGVNDVEELVKAMRFEDLEKLDSTSRWHGENLNKLYQIKIEQVLTDVRSRADIELMKESLELVPPSGEVDEEGAGGDDASTAAKEDDRIKPGAQVEMIFGSTSDHPSHGRRLVAVGKIRKKALALKLITQPQIRGKDYWVLEDEWAVVAWLYREILKAKQQAHAAIADEAERERKVELDALKAFREIDERVPGTTRCICRECAATDDAPISFVPADPANPRCPLHPTAEVSPFKQTTRPKSENAT